MWDDDYRSRKTPLSKNNSMGDDFYFAVKMALPVLKWIAKILIHPLARFFWLACIGLDLLFLTISIFAGNFQLGGVLPIAFAAGMFLFTNNKNKILKNEKSPAKSEKNYPDSNIQPHQFIEPTTQTHTHTIEPSQQELLEKYEQYKKSK